MAKAKVSPGATHRIEPYRDERGRYRWRILHRNGQNIAQCSQGRGYSRPGTALRAILNLLQAHEAGTIEVVASQFAKRRRTSRT